MTNPSRLGPLFLVLGSAALGHFLVVTPLVDFARALRSGRTLCPLVECTAAGVPLLEDTMMEEVPMTVAPAPPAARWAARFHASSMNTRDIWRGEMMGVVEPMGPHLAVQLQRARIELSPEAPRGVLRGIRIDLAEPTPDGSWRIVREGRPVELGMRVANGEVVTLPGLDLSLPRVAGADLRGRWLVATLLVDTPGGFSPLAHAHMDFEMAQRLAEVAIQSEANAPAIRVR